MRYLNFYNLILQQLQISSLIAVIYIEIQTLPKKVPLILILK